MILLVEAAFADGIQKVGGDVKSVHVVESSVLEGLSNDTGSWTDIHSDCITADTAATVFEALNALVNNILRLGEVDDLSPLVVSLGGEAGVPWRNLFLLGQMSVELVYDVSTFFCLARRGLALIRGLDVPGFLLGV